MAYDETSTASMDNHMVMRIQFVGKKSMMRDTLKSMGYYRWASLWDTKIV